MKSIRITDRGVEVLRGWQWWGGVATFRVIGTRRRNIITRPSKSSNSLPGGSGVTQECKHGPQLFLSLTPDLLLGPLPLANLNWKPGDKGAEGMHSMGAASWAQSKAKKSREGIQEAKRE